MYRCPICGEYEVDNSYFCHNCENDVEDDY